MKKMFLVAVLIMLSGYVLAGPTTTTTTTTIPDGAGKLIPTTATMSSCGNPPTVDYKFELPDETTATGTQIYPVAGGTKAYTVYSVVCDPNGASDIQTQKARVTWPNGVTYVENFGSVESNYANILQQAVDAGLIQSSDRDLILNKIDVQKLCKLYATPFTLDNCDPHGTYSVLSTACDKCGCGCTPLANTFEYMSIVAVDVDFTGVNYGSISVGNAKTVPGNSVMETVATAPPVMPTVQNLGNDPMDVKISATDMVGDCGGISSVILANAQTAKVGALSAMALSNSGVCFDANLACEAPAPIEFVLTPPLGTCASTNGYQGSLTVTGVHSC